MPISQDAIRKVVVNGEDRYAIRPVDQENLAGRHEADHLRFLDVVTGRARSSVRHGGAPAVSGPDGACLAALETSLPVEWVGTCLSDRLPETTKGGRAE
ncbi:hypothetical protein [Streptomyces sp. NPDC050704]|uniref:hypothetical protein n=1 Tax=Streptomyces sp. NPDC050704 TaxID=3157219 RepID=UPI0034194402